MASPTTPNHKGMVKATQLFERMNLVGNLTVDRDERVVRNVKLLGFESRNIAGSLNLTPAQRLQFGEALDHPYTYDSAFAQQVAEQYNGLQVYLDHPIDKASSQERSVKDLAGVVENAHVRADGIYGDIAYFEHTSGGLMLAEIAERKPKAVGCSHAAGGRTELRNNRVVVAEWAPRSVDIVTSPGTTTGLNESFQEPQMPAKPKKKLTIADILEHKSESKLGVALREMGDVGMAMPEMEVEEPIEEEGEASPEDQVKAGIVAAINAKLESASDDEILAVLAALGMSAPLSGESASDDTSADTEATESLRAELNALKAKTLLLESNRKATPERIEAVALSSRKSELVKSWPADLTESVNPNPRPHRSPPANSSGATSTRDRMKQLVSR